jgi:hypothetical protein
MKNKAVFVLLLAVAGLAIAAVYLYQKNAKLAQDLAQTIAQNQAPANGVKMAMVNVAQSDDFYNIRAEYPQIDSADPAFNQKIASTVNGLIDSFKKEAKENFDARNATMPAGQQKLQKPEQPFDFIAFWTPGQIGPRYASFIIDVYYFSGGAHGINRLFAFNYDLQNKKEVSIIDLIGGQAGLDKVAQLAKNQVVSQLEASGIPAGNLPTQMIASGTAATIDNYRNFTFGFGKLTIYFEQYQVAPGSFGAVTIALYKNDLDQKAINSDFLN